MEASPLISVIVPAYNVEKYLERCLDSLLKQTLEDFELIVVDDGAIDATPDICDDFANRDNRVTVIHQPNRGLSEARNAGTTKARGTWIAYVDGDDWVSPLYLERLHAAATKSEADIAICKRALVDEHTASLPEPTAPSASHPIDGHEACALLMRDHSGALVTAWGKLYNARLSPLLVYPMGQINEDEFVTYRAFYHADKVVLIDDELYAYVQHEGSITTAFDERNITALAAFDQRDEFFCTHGEAELLSLSLKNHLEVLRELCLKATAAGQKLQAADLHQRWKALLDSSEAQLDGAFSPAERIVNALFRVSPAAYGSLKGKDL